MDITVGMEVVVKDGSYAVSMTAGGLTQLHGVGLQALGAHKVVALNGTYPTATHRFYDGMTVPAKPNDAMIEAKDGTITFIDSRFLVPGTDEDSFEDLRRHRERIEETRYLSHFCGVFS